MSTGNEDNSRRIEIQVEESSSEPEPLAATPSLTPPPEEDPLGLLQAALEQERDAHLRALADLRNYRQRVAREQAEQARYVNQQLLSSLLPTLDHLEMALRAAEVHGEGGTALAEGVWLTYRQMLDTLAPYGLQPIPAEGEFFDPARHEALEREEVTGGTPCEGTITAELRKGWRLHDRILRPAQVRVAVERRAPAS
jgi:molecular chaperone GrpE